MPAVRRTRTFIIIILLIAFAPIFVKIADFSRFVIFTTEIHNLIYGILIYLLKNYTLLFLSISLVIFTGVFYVCYKIIRNRLFKDLYFSLGVFVFIFQVLPIILLKSVKPELLMVYLTLFICMFCFNVFRKAPHEYLRQFFYTILMLFPIFSIFLLIGFDASSARPKKTILNGGPEHGIFDERCDRKRLLSQREIKPIWLEDAWLYGGVATKDGRYVYFSDNGYGIVGFEVKDDGTYEKLPFVKYPPNFNAALYSHRLYLTPDERYLFYYGARSAEFVFIDRGRLEVAYVIPTRNGLDGFSATIDTRRNLIYGFPFIGKEVPVLSYENGLPRLIKWVDFSQVSGWAIQGFYHEKRDTLVITTSCVYSTFDAETLQPLTYRLIGPSMARFSYDSLNNRFLSSNYFFSYITVYDEYKIEEISVPRYTLEIYLDIKANVLFAAQLSKSTIWMRDMSAGLEKIIYSGPRARGFLKVNEDILFSSSCGVHKIILGDLFAK
ncbi:MAG: hypothetical protein N2746_11950 [Deltaproteobacteria bacterium]|nr:hypothetical protein [Deltaproteobacteria bacterium]